MCFVGQRWERGKTHSLTHLFFFCFVWRNHLHRKWTEFDDRAITSARQHIAFASTQLSGFVRCSIARLSSITGCLSACLLQGRLFVVLRPVGLRGMSKTAVKRWIAVNGKQPPIVMASQVAKPAAACAPMIYHIGWRRTGIHHWPNPTKTFPVSTHRRHRNAAATNDTIAPVPVHTARLPNIARKWQAQKRITNHFPAFACTLTHFDMLIPVKNLDF